MAPLAAWQPRDEFDLQIPYSCRLAAIAAAKLGAWDEAAEWLRRARDAADEDQAPFRAGLLMDEGFALWKAGDKVAAHDRLMHGCLAIDALPADADDQKAFLVRKWAGHTLMWIAARESGRTPEGFSEPRPAECSNLESLELPDLRPTPSAGLWLHLAEFEVEADLGDAAFRRCEAELTTTPYVVFRVSFGVVRIRQRLRTLALDDLVDVAADWAEALELARTHLGPRELDAVDQLPAGTPPVDRSLLNIELIRTVLINAVFALAARRPLTATDIEAWRHGATRSGVATQLKPWLDFTSKVLVDRHVNRGRQISSASAGLSLFKRTEAFSFSRYGDHPRSAPKASAVLRAASGSFRFSKSIRTTWRAAACDRPDRPISFAAAAVRSNRSRRPAQSGVACSRSASQMRSRTKPPVVSREPTSQRSRSTWASSLPSMASRSASKSARLSMRRARLNPKRPA